MRTNPLFAATGLALLVLPISAFTQRTSFLEPMSEPESAQSQQSAPESTAPEMVGIWEGGGKVGMGGTGQSKVRVVLKPDGTFDLALHLFEPAHALKPFPTSDEIEATGTWIARDHGSITLEATITKFVSSYKSADAARRGFPPDADDAREVVEQHLQLDPPELTMTLSIQEDGSRNFLFPPLQAKEKGTERPVIRFIGPAPMKQTSTDTSGLGDKIYAPGEELILVGVLVRVEDGEMFWMGIRPERPVRFVAFEGEPARDVEVLQIAGLDQDAWSSALELVGEKVQIQGSLMEAHTRYHHTAALIIPSSLEKAP